MPSIAGGLSLQRLGIDLPVTHIDKGALVRRLPSPPGRSAPLGQKALMSERCNACVYIYIYIYIYICMYICVCIYI